jgi:hypothetical protein
MAKTRYVNIGTNENPRYVDENLVWGNSFQNPDDHQAEKVASGSVLLPNPETILTLGNVKKDNVKKS